MIYHGYTPTTLIPICVVMAVVIGILYLLRVRRRVVCVPYLGIWREVLTKTSHRRFHDWLRRLLSFLICMSVVGLLALALLDPREEEDEAARRHAIIVIDTSASMMATDRECGTRFGCALRDARELIEHMRASDRAVIVEASGVVSSVSGAFQADKGSIARAVNALEPRATSADMKKAIELAVHLAEGRKNAEIFLLTDGQFDDAEAISAMIPQDVAFEQRTYGQTSGNIAIESFNVRRYIANRLGFEVFCRVHNGFDVPVTVEMNIWSMGEDEAVYDATRVHEKIATKKLTIASGSSEVRLYENLTLSSSRMVAEVRIVDPEELEDPLKADNLAYARIPDFVKSDIACVTPGNLYLEAALLLNENYRVTFVRPESSGIDLGSLASSHDIVILDNSYGNLPHLVSPQWSGRVIFINPDGEDSPFSSRRVENPVVERVNSRHPVARWLGLKNLNIARSHIFSGVSGSDVVMRAIEGPLVATRARDSQRLVAIGFSLIESDLIFRVGLPILFINAVDWLRDENSEPMRAFATGTSFHMALSDAPDHVDVETPEGRVLSGIPVYEGATSIYGETAGFYRVHMGEKRVFDFAANFVGGAESDLSREPSQIRGRIHLRTTLGDEVADEETSWLLELLAKLPQSSQYLWVLALLVAMGILTVEWVTYHRRWTV